MCTAKQNKNNKGLTLAFYLNTLFAIIEFIGGFLTNSTAIIADAFHDLMDAVAIGIAVFMEKYSRKPSSENYSFGYRRFALLSALIMSVILFVGAVLMMYKAITSFNTSKEVNSLGMLGLAVLGILINGFAFWKIKNSNNDSHHHGHGHSHIHNHQSQDANSRAVMLHLLEDVLGWIAVLVGSILMYFTNWYWIDSVLTAGIALFIGYNACKNLHATFKIILQSTPEGISIETIKNEIAKNPNVKEISSVQVWTIDGETNIANIHLSIQHVENYPTTLSEIKETLSNFRISESTIEINPD